MKLSKRLETIASFIPKDAVIADIGSDHCALPIALIERGQVKKAVAIENKKGPFIRMSEAVAINNLQEQIECLFSDGISIIPREVDTIIIAGMGGKLISKILNNHPESLADIKTIIIDAHRDKEEAIRTLEELSFQMVDEAVVLDSNVYYDIQKWAPSPLKALYSEIEVKYGPINIKKNSVAWKAYLKEQQRICLNTLSIKTLPRAKEKELKKELQEIELLLTQ